MTPPGRLHAIWLKRFKHGPMDPRESAFLIPGRGLEGNANQGGRRQVTLLTEEGWSAANAELGTDLHPAARRANLFLSGIPFEGTRGRVLRIGPARLRIWMECAPCHQMDEAQAGLQQALRPNWRGGACTQVIEGGEIRVGDEVEWEADEHIPAS